MIRLFIASLLACTMMLSSPAMAQSSEKAAARSMALEGLKHFKAEEFAKALDLFSRAHSLVGAPTTGLWKARSLEKVGRWVEATELYLDVVETDLDDDADPRWVKAVDQARKERATLLPRVPKLKIELSGDGAAVAKVSIDGRTVPSALLGVSQPIDPGTHLVVAKHASARVEKRVTLRPGERADAGLSIAALESGAATPAETEPTDTDPAETSTPTEEPTSSAPPAAPPEKGGSSNVGAWVAFSVAGAAAIGTGIVGGLTAAEESRLIEQCPNGKCQNAADFGTYDTLRITTFSLAGVTGVAAITGVVLLVAAGGDDDDEKSAAWRTSLQPIISPNYVGIHGRF